MDQNHEKLTKSKDRSEGNLGLFWGIFDFMVDRRKIEGKYAINLALDTNMLGVTPWGGRIFHESPGNRGGSEGDEEGGETHELTRKELDEHTHTHTHTHTKT